MAISESIRCKRAMYFDNDIINKILEMQHLKIKTFFNNVKGFGSIFLMYFELQVSYVHIYCMDNGMARRRQRAF